MNLAVILSARDLLGVSPGAPTLGGDIALWRDLLLILALAAAVAEARGRRRTALALAALIAFLAIAFWVVAFARPYGVLVDVAITDRAAELAVRGWSGGEDGFVSGEQSLAGWWGRLAAHVRPDLVILLPTLLPAFVFPASVLAVAALWKDRDRSLAAILWVAAATGALDLARKTAWVPGLWTRPGPSLLWLATVAATLVVARSPARISGLVALLPTLGWLVLGRRPPAPGFADALLTLTLDHNVWLVAGLVGLRRYHDRAAVALAGGGAVLVLSRALGGPGDAWAGAAFCRLGLTLASAQWLGAMAAAVPVDGAMNDIARRWGMRRESLPTAIAMGVLLTGSFVVWWDPVRTDPLAKASTEPVPIALVEAMQWVRDHTDPQASVIADREYAPAVAVLAGRRVLRAPAQTTPVDDERRVRLEKATLTAVPPPSLVQRYRLGYVFIAPGQFREYGLEDPRDLERLGTMDLRYENAKGMRVYALRPAAGSGGAFK